jgi:putative sigma-54 modulation protein
MRIRGEESSGDMYGSIDGAAQKIERQLKRYRNKLANHKAREGHASKVMHTVIEGPPVEASELPAETPTSVVERHEFDARPMLLEEAMMQMDLLHEDFHVFTNAKNNQVNVLYRRKEGNFGLIEAKIAG